MISADDILQATGIPRRLFPRLVEAGEQIGVLQNEAASQLGLPVGIPVISAGHDTQFALFGAGAQPDEPVLSSGTWEILMVRSAQVDTSLLSHYAGSTCELDSQVGLYNPGMQWLASGVLEWVRKAVWTAESPRQTLIDEARSIPAGAEGVKMHCDLLACQNAGWQGLPSIPPADILSRRTGRTDRTVAAEFTHAGKIGHFRATELLLVGGEAATHCGTRLKRMFSGSLSKCWMTPKPPSQAPQCLPGQALGNLPPGTGPRTGALPVPLLLSANRIRTDRSRVTCLKQYPLNFPDLLKVLAEMGHGDEIIFSDAHFPAIAWDRRSSAPTVCWSATCCRRLFRF